MQIPISWNWMTVWIPGLTEASLQAFHDLPEYQRKQNDAAWKRTVRERHADEAFRAEADGTILLRKNYEAMGSFRKEDRSRALDLLGFASQLVFTTFCLRNFGLDEAENTELGYAAARAHNRMMTDFCSVDRRLLATGYVPLGDFERALATAKDAIALGAKALLIPSYCPPTHSPSHVGLDPVWALAQEARIPILFHVGGETRMNPTYLENGMPRVKDFHGGEENFTSVSFMAIPGSVMQTLSSLIIDGVFDRFPRLKFGAIELGASWLPGWMRFMDSAHAAFYKNEERLHRLSAHAQRDRPPTACVSPPTRTRTPVGSSAKPDRSTCLFSSDYPHVEGGRNPLKRFDDSLRDASAEDQDAFYAGNFIDLMGEGWLPISAVPRLAHAA